MPTMDELLERNALLEQQVKELRGGTPESFHWLGITRSEEAILNFLLNTKPGVVATRMAIYNHLYWDRLNPPVVKVLDVLVCKLRNRLRVTSGLEQPIVTVWGRGYLLPSEFREWLVEAIARRKAEDKSG